MFLVALSEYDQVLVESDNEVSFLYHLFSAFTEYIFATETKPFAHTPPLLIAIWYFLRFAL